MIILVNSLILLGFIGLALAVLFWKHFAKAPGETTRAFIATVVGTVALVGFLFQVAIMSTSLGANIITIVMQWLNQ